MRLILVIATTITASSGYQATMPCAKIDYILQSNEALLQSYPACAPFVNGTNPDQYTIIDANFNGTDAAQIAAAVNITAGMALWLAFLIHAVGVEIYVSSLILTVVNFLSIIHTHLLYLLDLGILLTGLTIANNSFA